MHVCEREDVLREEIKQLKERQESLEKEYKALGVERIKSILKESGLTIDDLQLDRRMSVRPKYRNPVTGETWSGRGLTPKWLRGQDKEIYRIAGV